MFIHAVLMCWCDDVVRAMISAHCRAYAEIRRNAFPFVQTSCRVQSPCNAQSLRIFVAQLFVLFLLREVRIVYRFALSTWRVSRFVNCSAPDLAIFRCCARMTKIRTCCWLCRQLGDEKPHLCTAVMCWNLNIACSHCRREYVRKMRTLISQLYYTHLHDSHVLVWIV